MIPSMLAAEDRLRATGMRVTPQRLAILQFLQGTDRHPTADEIEKAVNGHIPRVSRASVYNVLHSLAEIGLVLKVLAGNAVTRYDANTTPHHHFVCGACGDIEDVPWEAARLPDAPSLHGRAVDRYEVVMHGRCDRCN